MGVDLNIRDWERVGHQIHLLANVQPAGEFLGEAYHRAGGVGAIFGELMQAGKIRTGALTVTGTTIGENYKDARSLDTNVIRTYDNPLKQNAGLLVVSGNLFSSALVKTSVISDEFRRRYLSDPGQRGLLCCARGCL